MTKKPNLIPAYLGTTLPSQSTFFISFLMLCAFTVYPFELLRPVPLAIVAFKRKFFNMTPREAKESWRPPPAAYDALVRLTAVNQNMLQTPGEREGKIKISIMFQSIIVF
jgi:hypothetical protein